MADDARSLKFFSRYNLAEKHWTVGKKSDYRNLKREFLPSISPDEFLQALNILWAHTELRCFLDASEVLLERKIIDGSGWNMDALVPALANSEAQREVTAETMSRFFVESGMSRRLAMANTAANLLWPGNSFEAAVKSLDRLSQRHFPQKNRTTQTSKCPKTSAE